MKIEFVRNVYPGDVIHEKGNKCIGIYDNKASVMGQLCKIEDLYFIRSKTKRYSPTKHDIVIGRITFTCQDYYKVDLGGITGCLPTLSFLNATKRNRPELQKNDFVLCQVVRVETDPLLTCKIEGMGKIDEAFPVDSWKIRHLYFSDILPNYGKTHSFNIALGMNGFVWIESSPEVKREVLKIIRDLKE